MRRDDHRGARLVAALHCLSMALALPWGVPLTYDDVQRFPPDGHRYELVEGSLLVTPAPNAEHQSCVMNLAVALKAAAGEEHFVVPAPFDFYVSELTYFEPDIVVALDEAVGDDRLGPERTPLLVVEIGSRSTRLLDLGTKRLAYEAAGVPEYWLVDPDEPSLTVLRLSTDATRRWPGWRATSRTRPPTPSPSRSCPRASAAPVAPDPRRARIPRPPPAPLETPTRSRPEPAAISGGRPVVIGPAALRTGASVILVRVSNGVRITPRHRDCSPDHPYGILPSWRVHSGSEGPCPRWAPPAVPRSSFLLRYPGRRSSCGTPVVVPPAVPRSSFLLRYPGRRSSCGTPVVVPPAVPRSSFLLRYPGRRSSCGTPVTVPPAGPGHRSSCGTRSSFLLRDPVVVPPAVPRSSFLLRDSVADASGH